MKTINITTEDPYYTIGCTADKKRLSMPLIHNIKSCPFKECVCKFKHIAITLCRFGKTCQRNMCPFRHKEIEKEKEDSTDTEIKVMDLESFEMEDFENVEDSKSPTNKEFVCDECVECFVNQNIQTED